MEWKAVSAHWEAFVPSILTRWPDLDPVEVEAADGSRSAMVAELSRAGELSTDEAEEMLDEWLTGAVPADVIMDEGLDNMRISQSYRDIPDGEDPSDDDRMFGGENEPEDPKSSGE